MVLQESFSIDKSISSFNEIKANRPKIQNPKLLMRNFSIQNRKPFQWALKRIFDFTASATGLFLLSPVLAIVALLIKRDSEGPIFYKQKRVGKYGKEYTMYKFRSMKVDADKEFDKIKQFNQTNELMFKMNEDPRITGIGKYLRKYSIDELPQLFNVVKGDMSLVGPRPPIMREVLNYENHHYLRLATVPGITGLWQVSGRSSILQFNKVFSMDYAYINNWSFLTDIIILIKTIPVVLFAKDAA